MASISVGPTVETIGVVMAVFAVQLVLVALGIGFEVVALAAPFATYPWTLVTSVYAHAGATHLVANLVGLAIFGFIVERRSSRFRFHAFVLFTGMTAGIAEVLIGGLVGPSPVVLGISGAVFALMGYVLASNPVTDTVLEWLEVDPRIQLVLMVILAVGITWVTRGDRVALIAHFTGFLLGLAAGRLHLLRAPRGARR